MATRTDSSKDSEVGPAGLARPRTSARGYAHNLVAREYRVWKLIKGNRRGVSSNLQAQPRCQVGNAHVQGKLVVWEMVLVCAVWLSTKGCGSGLVWVWA